MVLDVTGCVMCQDSNGTYVITVEASNRGGETAATTSLSKNTSKHICSTDLELHVEQLNSNHELL